MTDLTTALSNGVTFSQYRDMVRHTRLFREQGKTHYQQYLYYCKVNKTIPSIA